MIVLHALAALLTFAAPDPSTPAAPVVKASDTLSQKLLSTSEKLLGKGEVRRVSAR